MKATGLVCVLIGVLCAPVAEAQDAKSAKDASAKLEAKVLSLAGPVEVRKDTRAKWKALTRKSVLTEGMWIQTGRKARVYLRFGDHSVLEIRSGTTVILQRSLKKKKLRSRVHVKLGSVRASIPKKEGIVDVEVSTQQVVVSVRGTVFEVGYSSDFGSTYSVSRGRVQAAHRDGRSTIVQAGEASTDKVMSTFRSVSLRRVLVVAPDQHMKDAELLAITGSGRDAIPHFGRGRGFDGALARDDDDDDDDFPDPADPDSDSDSDDDDDSDTNER